MSETKDTRWGAALIVVTLGALLMGCATSTPTARTVPQATTTATATPTHTPAPLSSPTVSQAQRGQACAETAVAPTTQIGGLTVAAETVFGNLTGQDTKLPDGLPLAPYQIGQGTDHLDGTPVNPKSGGYVISLCNLSSAPHTLQRVDARLDSLIPYTGPLNVWAACTGTAYARPQGAFGAGCGGVDPANSFLQAPLPPTATPGDSVTAQQPWVNAGGPAFPGGTKLPTTIEPGQGITVEVTAGGPPNGDHTYFTTAGTYTFAFGLGVDGAAPVFAVTSPATLYAPIAHAFAGASCAAPAMQAQIPPATNPPTYYICP